MNLLSLFFCTTTILKSSGLDVNYLEREMINPSNLVKFLNALMKSSALSIVSNPSSLPKRKRGERTLERKINCGFMSLLSD
jgi:hypothetical protein